MILDADRLTVGEYDIARQYSMDNIEYFFKPSSRNESSISNSCSVNTVSEMDADFSFDSVAEVANAVVTPATPKNTEHYWNVFLLMKHCIQSMKPKQAQIVRKHGLICIKFLDPPQPLKPLPPPLPIMISFLFSQSHISFLPSHFC